MEDIKESQISIEDDASDKAAEEIAKEEPADNVLPEDAQADAGQGSAGDSGSESDEAEGTKADETEAEGSEEAAKTEAAAGEEKKGLFKKKEKKKDKKDEKIEELTDQLKRQMAEFENFRKRTEKEKDQMFEIGAKSIVEKVLPVVDNFERGLAAVPAEQQEDAFVDGMNKVYKQMMSMLEEAGVVPIDAVGKEFDPNLHNAVMQVDSEEYEPGIVAQEMQKGYLYRESVVRHSMVAVVKE